MGHENMPQATRPKMPRASPTGLPASDFPTSWRRRSCRKRDGLLIEVFNKLLANVVTDRSQFWKDLSLPFDGYNRPGANCLELDHDGRRENKPSDCTYFRPHE
jgi:hypothetical protein